MPKCRDACDKWKWKPTVSVLVRCWVTVRPSNRFNAPLLETIQVYGTLHTVYLIHETKCPISVQLGLKFFNLLPRHDALYLTHLNEPFVFSMQISNKYLSPTLDPSCPSLILPIQTGTIECCVFALEHIMEEIIIMSEHDSCEGLSSEVI